jgi:hypothetical protein
MIVSKPSLAHHSTFHRGRCAPPHWRGSPARRHRAAVGRIFRGRASFRLTDLIVLAPRPLRRFTIHRRAVELRSSQRLDAPVLLVAGFPLKRRSALSIPTQRRASKAVDSCRNNRQRFIASILRPVTSGLQRQTSTVQTDWPFRLTKRYVAETGNQAEDNPKQFIRVFAVGEGGVLSGGRVFAKIEPGYCDGMTVDEDGNIWSSAGDGVHCLSPQGDLLGKIFVPHRVANLKFGGLHRNRLFIGGSQTLYAHDGRRHDVGERAGQRLGFHAAPAGWRVHLAPREICRSTRVLKAGRRDNLIRPRSPSDV